VFSEAFTETSALMSAARLIPSAARLIRFDMRLLNCTVFASSSVTTGPIEISGAGRAGNGGCGV
jgi:hypothetical protein